MVRVCSAARSKDGAELGDDRELRCKDNYETRCKETMKVGRQASPNETRKRGKAGGLAPDEDVTGYSIKRQDGSILKRLGGIG